MNLVKIIFYILNYFNMFWCNALFILRLDQRDTHPINLDHNFIRIIYNNGGIKKIDYNYKLFYK